MGWQFLMSEVPLHNLPQPGNKRLKHRVHLHWLLGQVERAQFVLVWGLGFGVGGVGFGVWGLGFGVWV